jgi:aminomethyltransferase
MSRQTALHDEHHKLGATFTDFAGWEMPVRYGSDLDEHHAVRKTAGLFDLSHMGEIRLTGPDAGAALDYSLAGKLSAIALGRAKYSLLCREDGGVLDDLVVYRLAEHDYLVVANASNAALVHTELASRSAHFDVDVVDESSGTALLALQGPSSAEILSSLLDPPEREALGELKYYSSTPACIAGVEVLLARTGYTGEDGFELYVDNDQAPTLWRVLLEATTAAGGAPAGLACRDTLRLEAGMALYGHELDVDTNPYEAGLGRVIVLSKNFVGGQALQQLSRQPMKRQLVGLIAEGRRAARAGYPVLHEGAPVGVITSGVLSPTLQCPIALAYVRTDLASPDTELNVDIRGTELPFTVAAIPFYRRPRS